MWGLELRVVTAWLAQGGRHLRISRLLSSLLLLFTMVFIGMCIPPFSDMLVKYSEGEQ